MDGEVFGLRVLHITSCMPSAWGIIYGVEF